MWILKSILPDFISNSLFGEYFVPTVGVIFLFVGVFFSGALIDAIKYKEGFAETFIIAGFVVIAFIVAISCLF